MSFENEESRFHCWWKYSEAIHLHKCGYFTGMQMERPAGCH